MQKEIADTIALLFTQKLLSPEYTITADSTNLAINIVKFANELSQELQNEYGDVDLNLFQGNQPNS